MVEEIKNDNNFTHNESDTAIPLRTEMTFRGSNTQVHITRGIFTQMDIQRLGDFVSQEGEQYLKYFDVVGVKRCFTHICPIVFWLPKYRFKKWILSDLLAGITVAVMLVPQGMANGMMAKAPPVVGIYMAFIQGFVYALFSNCKHASAGPVPIICLMAGNVVTKYSSVTSANNNSNKTAAWSNIEVLMTLTMLVGLLQLALWALRLGAAASIFSEPLVSAFIMAASLHVIVEEINDMFGTDIPNYTGNFNIFQKLYENMRQLPNLNKVETLMSSAGIFVILLSLCAKKRIKKSLRKYMPMELLIICVAVLVCKLFDLNKNYNVKIVGHIPLGLPSAKGPNWELLSALFMDALIISIVSFGLTFTVELSLAREGRYIIYPNQEMFALAMSNIIGSFFTCPPVCAEIVRSHLSYSVGAKTQLSNIIQSGFLLLILLSVAFLFENLPRSILATIVIIYLAKIASTFGRSLSIFSYTKLDGLIWFITFSFSMLHSIVWGLLAGVISNIIILQLKTQLPYSIVLGRIPDTEIYMDIDRYKGAVEYPGIKIFGFYGAINFLTKGIFRTQLYNKSGYPIYPSIKSNSAEDMSVIQKIRSLPRQTSARASIPKILSLSSVFAGKKKGILHIPNNKKKLPVAIVVDLSSVPHIDSSGFQMIKWIYEDLKSRNVVLILARANCWVIDSIQHCSKVDRKKRNFPNLFPTLHDTVLYLIARRRKLKKLYEIIKD